MSEIRNLLKEEKKEPELVPPTWVQRATFAAFGAAFTATWAVASSLVSFLPAIVIWGTQEGAQFIVTWAGSTMVVMAIAAAWALSKRPTRAEP